MSKAFISECIIYMYYISQQINYVFQPFPKQQILDSSKLNEFADDIFKFDNMAESYPKG